ncbi:ribosomal RNA assembly protein mis3 [Pseudohyphozyma bogoriensis]|nr:ribosomal RNA assembly protein mis3 [Pseudohyphozyma bogoriensis]
MLLRPLTPRTIRSPPTLRRSSSSRSPSSTNYLARQRRDPFVRSRSSNDEQYVARSAFKLLELQDKVRGGAKLLRRGMTVVDLGAAPGGWVQAAWSTVVGGGESRKGKEKATEKKGMIIAVDLLPLAPQVVALPNVVALQGNFLDPLVKKIVVDKLGSRKVDLVLSDMLANVSGNHEGDAARSVELCRSALQFAEEYLEVQQVEEDGAAILEDGKKKKKKERSPVLVMKCLQSREAELFKDTLRSRFESVRWEKPTSSRAESREGFWVCAGLKPRHEEVIASKGKEGGNVDEDSIFF